MPAAYSNDLRQKAVAAVQKGERKAEVYRMFNISRNTLHLWLQREAQTGDCRAKTGYQKGYGLKITDLEVFKSFVTEHPDKTQAEMAELLSIEVSPRSISRALRKIGFTRKKNLWLSRKR